MQVDIFTRDVSSDGEVYPRGAMVPVGVFAPPKEQQLRRNNIIRSIEFEDINDLVGQASGVLRLPEQSITTVNALVEKLERELALATAFRDTVFDHFGVESSETPSDESDAEEDTVDDVNDVEVTSEESDASGDVESDSIETSDVVEERAEATEAEAEKQLKEDTPTAVRKPLSDQSRSELEQTATELGIKDASQKTFPNKEILTQAIEAHMAGLPAEDAVSRIGQKFPFEA